MLNPELLLEKSSVSTIAHATGLDPVADAIQPAIRAARDANPRVKSALSGTWLGHALHPILTDVPIGAFTALAVLDTAELAGARDVARGADVTLLVGLAGAYAAALTGWADWSDTHDQARRVGLAHAAFNGAAILAYDASVALRVRGKRKTAIVASLLGYGIVSLGAYLGGELSTGMHLGVRHTAAPLPAPDDFVDVASLAEIEEKGMLRVDANGVPVLLAMNGAGVFAIGAVCSHRGGPLDEGGREGDCVRCPWHGAVFSLEDGRALEGPATFAVPVFETRIDNGRVAVRASKK
jgi:nitrite reductase/ring-hydroxylating ferredoxin subunit/uncharacterized membrane protein